MDPSTESPARPRPPMPRCGPTFVFETRRLGEHRAAISEARSVHGSPPLGLEHLPDADLDLRIDAASGPEDPERIPHDPDQEHP